MRPAPTRSSPTDSSKPDQLVADGRTLQPKSPPTETSSALKHHTGMPGRLLATLVFFFVAEAATADGAPTQYSLRYDGATETMAIRLCVPRAAVQMHFSAD